MDERVIEPEVRWRCYQRMARRMAALIPRSQIRIDDFIRADGRVICEECGLNYFDHPELMGMPTFHLLCTGLVIKT